MIRVFPPIDQVRSTMAITGWGWVLLAGYLAITVAVALTVRASDIPTAIREICLMLGLTACTVGFLAVVRFASPLLLTERAPVRWRDDFY